MTDTTTRPAPPPLEYRCPDCSLCSHETYHDGDGFRCDACEAWWEPSSGDNGEWDNPDAEQCDATCQPLADNTFATDEQRAKTYRCALTVNHPGDHASINYTFCVKGWA